MTDTSSQDIDTSIKGIQKWTTLMADALGVAPGDIHRTSGCEIEFLVTSEDEKAFRTRLGNLAEGGYKAKYGKNADFMPAELRPDTWQESLDRERTVTKKQKNPDLGYVADHI
jgi:hypothetical protein